MGTLLKDLRYAARVLRKSPGFTLVAVVAVALGVGANTAIFSVVNAVLLRPLPYKAPEQLVLINHNYPKLDLKASVSAPGFAYYRDNARSFAEMAAATGWSVNLTRNGEPYTVVGVMPPAVEFGREWSGQAPDLWSPLAFTPQQLDPNTGLTNEYLGVLARLKPGVSRAQAQAELDSIAADLRRQYMPGADASNWGLLLTPFDEFVVGNIRTPLLVLLGAVAFVLLISCANVANLMLARATARSKEIAIRAALGASRRRVVRQLLTESLLLSFAGGILGGLLALWGVHALVALSPPNLFGSEQVGVSLPVLGFTFAVSLLTGVVFGLLPAVEAARFDPNEALKESGRGTTGSPRARRFRSALVVSEIALALVLLVGAGLMIRSFARLGAVDP